MDLQPDFFEALPSTVNPRRHFLELYSGKIIPFSKWKDGRLRADLSAFEAGCPVSRNEVNLVERILDELECRHGENIERESESLNLVRQIRLALEQNVSAIPSKPRLKNKLAHGAQDQQDNVPALEFVNPKALIGTPGWEFGPSPRWLNNVQGITLAEIGAYGWMIFRADDDGIFRGSLRGIARDAKISWAHMSGNVISSLVGGRRLLHREVRGRLAWFRFLRHPAMDKGGQLSWPLNGQAALPRSANRVGRVGQLKRPQKEYKNKEEEEENSSNDW